MTIQQFFHLIHIVDDEDEADSFYDRLFSPQRFMTKGWSDVEKRWASLSMVSGLMLEVIEPSRDPAHGNMPLTKFHTRHGPHFHSLAWYVDPDGVKPLFGRLRAAGIRVARPGGGIYPDGEVEPDNTIFTHPKDTFGQIEFEGKQEHWRLNDPREQATWTTEPWRRGPLGIVRLSHLTTVVRDLGSARRFYQEVLGAELFHDESGGGADRSYALVGTDTVVELACPRDESTRLAADLAGHGELPHAATFRVLDLGAVERHAAALGVGVAERSEESMVLDPGACFGAVWSFTVRDLPLDPRGPVS